MLPVTLAAFYEMFSEQCAPLATESRAPAWIPTRKDATSPEMGTEGTGTLCAFQMTLNPREADSCGGRAQPVPLHTGASRAQQVPNKHPLLIKWRVQLKVSKDLSPNTYSQGRKVLIEL